MAMDSITDARLTGNARTVTDRLMQAMESAASNQEVTVLASGARTATPADVELQNAGARGVVLVIDVTAYTATGSLTVTLKGKDPLSGKVYTLLASAAINAVGTTVLKVYPGLTAAANAVANDHLPKTWVVSAVHGNAVSLTYSIGALLLV